ncbi:MAG: hypothetical protein OEX83_08760 [Gammaproteobacteria bacterium]|nr:hypothetical protein [Gammaproteobacteria bacterium]
MADDMQPIPEQWYRNIDEEVLFEVVSVDNDMIEIQYMDGEIKEIDMDTWEELELEPIENPQDWLGSYDDMDSDDFISNEDDDDWIGAYEERE